MIRTLSLSSWPPATTGALSPQPLAPCPDCHESAVRHLTKCSQDALVGYFRCDQCGHVYHLRKGVPDAARVTVAEGRRAGA